MTYMVLCTGVDLLVNELFFWFCLMSCHFNAYGDGDGENGREKYSEETADISVCFQTFLLMLSYLIRIGVSF